MQQPIRTSTCIWHDYEPYSFNVDVMQVHHSGSVMHTFKTIRISTSKYFQLLTEVLSLQVSILHHTSRTSPPFLLLLYMSFSRLHELPVFLVSPSDCCFAFSATADRYAALCVWWAGRHHWNNNHSACLYRAVSQFVHGTQETQCKTIIYNNMAGREHWGGGTHSCKSRGIENRCVGGLSSKWGMLNDLDWWVWHDIFYDTKKHWKRDTLSPSWDRHEPSGMASVFQHLLW